MSSYLGVGRSDHVEKATLTGCVTFSLRPLQSGVAVGREPEDGRNYTPPFSFPLGSSWGTPVEAREPGDCCQCHRGHPPGTRMVGTVESK